MSRPRRRWPTLSLRGVAALVLCALLAACGEASAGSDTTERRILPVTGDLAEVVYALGLGDEVVATDISVTYPEAAVAAPKIGYQRALVAEPIIKHDPTILLADEQAGPDTTLEQLRAAGVNVVMIERSRTIDEPAEKIRAVAEALGIDDDGLADRVQAQIDAAKAKPATTKPRVLALYLRGQDVQIVFGKGMGIDAVIHAAGGIDVGTELGIKGTAPLTAEAIIEARPDVILATTSGVESVGGHAALRELAGIARTPAAQHGQIYDFEDQYLYGLGPRTGDLLEELVAIFAAATTGE